MYANADSDPYVRMMMRTIALLFSMARLAEIIARKPLHLRLLVLWILHMGEAVARGLVVKEARNLGVEPPWVLLEPPPSTPVNRGDDALRLAASFRSLAFAFQQVLACAGFSGRRAGVPHNERLSGLHETAILLFFGLAPHRLRFDSS